MPNYRRSNTRGGTYFFTVVTHHRQPILCNENIRNALRRAIIDTRREHPFGIDGWVLLPDHMHCIWTLPPDDRDYGMRWARIKRHVSKHCGTIFHRSELKSPSRKRRHESTLWQRRFWEHRIRDDRDFQTHMDYIHFNPVKHGIVKQVRDWPYSTFHRYVRRGVYSPDWAGAGIEAIEGSFGE